MNTSIKVKVLIPVEVEFFISGFASIDSEPRVGLITTPTKEDVMNHVHFIYNDPDDPQSISFFDEVLGEIGQYTIFEGKER
jgi:hypothetical protein